jgi:hypothetical protein
VVELVAEHADLVPVARLRRSEHTQTESKELRS